MLTYMLRKCIEIWIYLGSDIEISKTKFHSKAVFIVHVWSASGEYYELGRRDSRAELEAK